MNQRGGYFAPAGTEYFTVSSAEWNKVGTLSAATKVTGLNGDYASLIQVNETTYMVRKADTIPGYCGDVYTVDRWHLTSDGVLTVEDEGIRLTSGALFEPFEYELSSFLKGKTVTYSFLFANNTLVTKSAVIPSTWGNWDSLIEIGDIQLIGLESGKRIWARYSSTTTAIAAKLELGGVQTLAHKENEKWVLNEIPDFGEQLRRCQRYHLGDMQRDAPGRISGNNTAYCVVPIPVTMRQSSATPVQAISKYGNIVDKDGAFHVVNNAYCVVEADSYLLFAVVSTETMPVGPCVWQDAHFSVSKDL